MTLLRPLTALPTQPFDDPDLLATMMGDMSEAPAPYRPTNYWEVYQKRFLPELERLGLADFRRRRGSVLSSFGATDLEPEFATVDLARSRLFQNAVTRLIPGWPALRSRLTRFVNRPGWSPVKRDLYGCSVADLKKTAFELVRLLGEKGPGRSITELESSLVGNPEDVFEVDGRHYTMRTLYYYLRYLYCAQFIDFDRVKVLVELGSGSGKQMEVIRKLHPGICFLLFDVPPQLYVAERFLGAVFADSVVSYRQTRDTNRSFEIRPGTIFICGSWMFPWIEGTPVDLFWNAVSFQEMEPHVVANYLRYVNRVADTVYLQQRMSGKEIARGPGQPGVLKQTTLEHYRAGLKDFELVDLSECRTPLGRLEEHSDSFWRRRGCFEGTRGTSREAYPAGSPDDTNAR